MQIKIEIDVRPDELRRFLGLPDVAGLQEDIVAFLRDKVGAASDFDASQFVKSNLETLRRSPAWQKIAARIRLGEDEPQPEARPAPTPRKRRRAPRKAKPSAEASSTESAKAKD
ncbi:hypothetical protein SAMN04488038_103162 [Solimonas aquatica]|uniref:Uncharacterized protein n=1 Tax=Solimonas aquatica TaxID=489703 RepID=A0A1H9CSD3_9GAMM|nr:hypothetical protein [Solimonas aquatica]SEQ04059.1 hypothetical protein SAMN04488038_103162 [Solimonas aquatica]